MMKKTILLICFTMFLIACKYDQDYNIKKIDTFKSSIVSIDLTHISGTKYKMKLNFLKNFFENDKLKYKANESKEFLLNLTRGGKIESFSNNQPFIIASSIEEFLKRLEDYLIKYNKIPAITFKDNDVLSYSKKIYTDKESLFFNSILYNKMERGFHVNNIFSIKEIVIDKKNYIQIKNPIPYKFENIVVEVEVNGSFFELFKLPFIDSFTEILIPLNDFRELEFFLRDNRLNYFDNLKLSSKDELLSKLNKIKAKNFISFKYYVGGNWNQIKSSHARLYIPAIINIYYMLSTKEFEQEYFKSKYKFYDNNKKNLLDSEKKEIFNKTLTKEIELTIIDNPSYGGLAIVGGKRLALNERKLNDFYRAIPSGVIIWAHEFAHNLGYTHDSNITLNSANDGYPIIWKKVYKILYEKNELPFMERPDSI